MPLEFQADPPPRDAPAPANDASLTEYAQLAKERRDLKDHLKMVEGRMEQLHPAVLAYFEQTSTQRVTRSGMTLFIRREIWAAHAEGADDLKIKDALRLAGMGEFVPQRVNWQSLHAYVREVVERGDALPPELEGAIRISEVFKVGARAA
jgi:hypothetical protein